MTRRSHPQHPPVGLTVAGSDSGGGAGIQADLKSMEAAGVFGTSVITAVTAQNTTGVTRSHVLPVAEIEAQLRSVLTDFDIRAAKTGMLATEPVIECTTDHLSGESFPLVVDPVMVAATGDRLLDPAAESAYGELLAAATLVTPNTDEATVLTGIAVDDTDSAIRAGEALVEMGATAALVKGGHVSGDIVTDILVRDDSIEQFDHPRVRSTATHGSGCTVASAIAAHLAHGQELTDAVSDALATITRAVRYPLDVGEGPGAVHHLVDLRNEAAKVSTSRAVTALVDHLESAPIAKLVPAVGMNVAGATPYAETPADVVAVEGRLRVTSAGVRRAAGVSPGASTHVAQFLLAMREHDPRLRYCLNCAFTDATAAVLDELDWTVGNIDRTERPESLPVDGMATLAWATERVMDTGDETPNAVIDHGAHGREPLCLLVSSSAETLQSNVLELATLVNDSPQSGAN